LRRIEVDYEIDPVDRCDGVYRVVIPFGFDGRATAGIPFGAEPRERFEEEVFRGEFFVQGYPNAFYASRWVDYSGDDQGMTFVAPHGAFTGYDLAPETRCLEFALLRQRSTDATHRGAGTPYMLGLGRHRFTVALVPHGGSWEHAGTVRDAFELHNPFEATTGGEACAGKETDAQVEWAAVEVTPATIVLSAARRLSAESWEIRVYESTGEATEVQLTFPWRPRRAALTDFRGGLLQEVSAVTIEGRRARLPMRPWQIATLKVTFA